MPLRGHVGPVGEARLSSTSDWEVTDRLLGLCSLLSSRSLSEWAGNHQNQGCQWTSFLSEIPFWGLTILTMYPFHHTEMLIPPPSFAVSPTRATLLLPFNFDPWIFRFFFTQLQKKKKVPYSERWPKHVLFFPLQLLDLFIYLFIWSEFLTLFFCIPQKILLHMQWS